MSHASVRLTTHKAPFTEEKSVKSTEIYPLDKVAWVLPDEINTMKNCAHCNRGLATMLGEANVLFVARLSPFDLAQGAVCGRKVGYVT